VKGITGQAPKIPTLEDGATDLQLLRPSLVVAGIGLLVAALLLWIGQPGPSQQAWRWQLAQSAASAQAATLRQAFAQMTADTLAAALHWQLRCKVPILPGCAMPKPACACGMPWWTPL
jgi:hypothetical protein